MLPMSSVCRVTYLAGRTAEAALMRTTSVVLASAVCCLVGFARGGTGLAGLRSRLPIPAVDHVPQRPVRVRCYRPG